MNCHINRWSDDGSIDCVEHLYVMGIDNNDDADDRIQWCGCLLSMDPFVVNVDESLFKDCFGWIWLVGVGFSL